MPGSAVSLQRRTPAFRTLCLTLFTSGFSIFSLLYSPQALLPAFVREFGVTPAQSSLAVSAATGAAALTIFLSGLFADSFRRRTLIVGALTGSALLTLAAAGMRSWPLLLWCRALMGAALGGMPSVVMAYLAEEVEPRSLSIATGIYLSGSVCGGMCGRLFAGMASDPWGWRSALAVIGLVSLAGALYAWRVLPASRHHEARHAPPAERLRSYLLPFGDAGLPWLFAGAALHMGGFVTVYNYVAFRLMRPPYSLRPALVSLIFVLYLTGMGSSTLAGLLASHHGRQVLYWPSVAIMLAGVVLTLAAPLGLVAAGIGLVTFGMFGAHSLASSWVGERGGPARAQAAALYLTFYYLGSSVAGWIGGFAWSAHGWPGVAGMVAAMEVVAVAIGLRLARLPPLQRQPIAAR